MGHSKAMLLINNQEPQFIVGDILGKETVGTDDEINFTSSQITYDLFLLCAGAKTV